MRVSYWSNSSFAKWLRTIFKLPPQPYAATAEEWDRLDKLEKETSVFGISLIESLDVLQSIVYYIPDTFHTCIYKLSNTIKQTHVLKTKVKIGNWGDLAGKIPDALMLGIVDFVENECFHMDVRWCSERPDHFSDKVWNYTKQSYFMQKLFPIKISRVEREFHGLNYIKFQMENSYEEHIAAWQTLIDAYKFAKTKYFEFDAWKEVGYHDIERDAFMKINDAQRDAFDRIRVLEEQFETEVSLHCCNIVKQRSLLWT